MVQSRPFAEIFESDVWPLAAIILREDPEFLFSLLRLHGLDEAFGVFFPFPQKLLDHLVVVDCLLQDLRLLLADKALRGFASERTASLSRCVRRWLGAAKESSCSEQVRRAQFGLTRLNRRTLTESVTRCPKLGRSPSWRW